MAKEMKFGLLRTAYAVKVWGCGLVFGVIVGCAHVRSMHELTPIGRIQGPVLKNEGEPVLFREGEKPDREGVRIASLTAEGNTYATRDALEKALIGEAKKVNADYLVITHKEVIRDQVAVHPRSGVVGTAISVAQGTGDTTVISRPALHGVAGRWATASIGVVVDENGTVRYVKSESPGERAGISEGMRIVAINGKIIDSQSFVFESEVLSRQVGEVVHIEAINPDASKQRVTVQLENPTNQYAVKQASFSPSLPRQAEDAPKALPFPSGP